MTDKKKLLCWADSPVASTGFGTVSKYVVGALNATDKFEIDQLAINYHGQFVNKTEVPWQLSPARLADPNDPYGNKMFLRSLQEKDYDYVWILNDTFVVHQVAEEMNKILEKKKESGKKRPVVVFYYPVDCRIIPELSGMLKYADVIVAYNQFGKQETLKVFPEYEYKLSVIHHGTDPQLFRPFSKDLISSLKEKYFGLSPDTFLVINFNRNSQRKQIAKTMLAFKEFKKYVPKSVLYLHTAPQDRDIDLIVAAKHIALAPKTDLIFPPNYSAANGYPVHVLNELYNCGDMFVTTHVGEGWGLTVSEAMAAGVPVVAPNNTSMPEILGTNNERGFMYECNDECYIDNSGYRKFATTDVVLKKMLEVHKMGWKHNLKQVVAGRKWIEQNDWSSACSEWLELFNKLETNLPVASPSLAPVFVGDLL